MSATDDLLKEIFGEHEDVVGTKEPAIPTIGDEAITGWSYTQWTKRGANLYPGGATVQALAPGLYDIGVSQNMGLFFTPVPVKTEGIILFPDTHFEAVMKEVDKFWSKEETYRKFGLAFKRGFLLHGPPGAGKSSMIQLIMRDVIKRGGIGINFSHPQLFAEGFRALRAIQPKVPVVALMEDLDEIVKQFPKSQVLDVLDGTERVDNIIFVASTNYPEMLESRISNRPSRFDRRWEIGYPSEAARKYYLDTLCRSTELKPAKLIKKIVADTSGMSFAHIKELFIATVILEDDYDYALGELKKMGEKISSEKYSQDVMGFILKGAKAAAGFGAAPAAG